MAKKAIAEFIGTFVLVFIGTGAAVLGGGTTGIGILGIAAAFGLALMIMCYAIGNISGCHINPAVSVAMFINKRISFHQFISYIIAQILGAILASSMLFIILKSGHMPVTNLGQNSFGHFGAGGAFLTEFILTFILVVTSKKGNGGLVTGIVIGLSLTTIHLVGIPVTGMSANPARSIGPALLVCGLAIKQLWLFILAPICGGILSAIISRFILDTEK